MYKLVLSEDDEEFYRAENQDLVLAVTDNENDYIIKGYSSIDHLKEITANLLIFIYNTIMNNDDEDYKNYTFSKFTNEVLDITEKILNLDKSVILKCSNMDELDKASKLAADIGRSLKNKLPENYEFAGLDYDELMNQIGEENDN